MKLTWITSVPKGKPIRFFIDLSKADNINNIPFTIEPDPHVGVIDDEDKTLLLICRYRIYATNKTNDEIVGYLREFRSQILSFEGQEKDLPTLTKFCSDAFINVEMDFQDKFGNTNIFARTRPPFDTLGQSLLQQLGDAGYYR